MRPRIAAIWMILAVCNTALFADSKQEDNEDGFHLEAVERERVIRAADLYLIEPVVTITAFEAERSEGGRHDYYSEGDYWWPNPDREDGLPYVRRDGRSNPDNFLKHRRVMRRLSVHVPALTAAYLLTHDQRYADHAAAHLEAWFVDEQTRMNPDLRYGQAIPGRTIGRSIGIIDTLHLAEVARAAKVLKEQQAISSTILEGVDDWFEAYLDWLTTSSMGRRERDHPNNHSTAWLVQVAAFADLLDDEAMLDEARDRLRHIIIPNQMDRDGSFQRELRRTKPYGYSLFNWDLLGILHQILSTPEEDLWRFETEDGRGMERATDFIVPYIADKDSWPYDPDVMYHHEWPMGHPTLLFAGIAYDRPDFIELWKELPADSSVHEVVRNFPVRQPLLWTNRGAPDFHIHMISGSAEYRSDFGLRKLIQALRSHYPDIRITASWAADEGENLPDIHHLADADLLVIFARRMTPPQEQMAYIRSHVDAGKPVIGIRTASHAFENFAELDPEVFGGSYESHGGDEPTVIHATDDASNHPILEGISLDAWSRPGKLYMNAELAESTTVLLRGSGEDTGLEEPVAWVNRFGDAGQGRAFYTSLGHPHDFENADFKRMILNAIRWAIDEELDPP